MGRKERREREEKRENYATKHSAAKRKQTLIAVGVFAVIGVIVGYSVYLFVTMEPGAEAGGPENVGPRGSAHDHAALLVRIFGDQFDFSNEAYQIKTPWIHFEGRDGTTIHKHATGVKLGYLFESIKIGLDDQCYVFTDGRSYCTQDENVLRFFINREPVSDIRDYEVMEDDRILILYGAETPEEIDAYLSELENQILIKR